MVWGTVDEAETGKQSANNQYTRWGGDKGHPRFGESGSVAKNTLRFVDVLFLRLRPVLDRTSISVRSSILTIMAP